MACGSCEYIKWKIELVRFSCAYRYMTAQNQGGIVVGLEIPPPANTPTQELPIPMAREVITYHLRNSYGLVDGATACDPNGRCRCIRTGKYTEELGMRVRSALPQPQMIPPLGQQTWWECDVTFEVIIRKLVAKGQCFPNLEGEQINPPDDD